MDGKKAAEDRECRNSDEISQQFVGRKMRAMITIESIEDFRNLIFAAGFVGAND